MNALSHPCPTLQPSTFAFTSPSPTLFFVSLSDNRGDTQGLPNPSSSLPTSPGLSGQWVSIRAWPSRRLATSMLTLAKQLGQGCGEMDSRVDSPHCALLLPADGVLPWEAIIARCQLTARFYCQCDQPSSSGFL